MSGGKNRDSNLMDKKFAEILGSDEISSGLLEKEVVRILGELSLKEKLAQMSGDVSLLRGLPGMMIRYNSKPISAGTLKKRGIPGIRFTDGPRGIVVGHSTCFPVPIMRAASWNIELEENIGDIMGREARAWGANFFGGICINLLRHPGWGRAQECYGEDPFLTGEMGAALVRGVQKHVMGCIKHYACNSIEKSRFRVNVICGDRSLREVYTYPFYRCIKEGAASVMSAYNKLNGKYCGHNDHLINGLLKDEMGFDGFVITDFILGIRDGAEAVRAGVDIEMPFAWRMSPRKLMKYLARGEITRDMIDRAVFRILKKKLLFSVKYSENVRNGIYYGRDIVCSERHISTALEAAIQGAVLLKNDGILPLKKVKKVAVVGRLAVEPNIGDHGSSRVYPPYVVTPLEGIIEYCRNKNIGVYFIGRKPGDIRKNADKIKDADAIVAVIGFDYRDEGEYMSPGKGGDRVDLHLKKIDREIISLLEEYTDKIIAVSMGGSAYIPDDINGKVNVLLHIWYPGMEGGTALARLLFGGVSPSGRLPVTFPPEDSVLPEFDPKADTVHYDYYFGYRTEKNAEYRYAYPFGYGLSYSEFRLTSFEINGDEVSFTVLNTGDFPADTVVQLYVSHPDRGDMPVRRLCGFARIHTEPDIGTEGVIRIPDYARFYYDTNVGQFTEIESDLVIHLGFSSVDTREIGRYGE